MVPFLLQQRVYIDTTTCCTSQIRTVRTCALRQKFYGHYMVNKNFETVRNYNSCSLVKNPR